MREFSRGPHPHIVLVHDATSCDFDTILLSTPPDLIQAKLYSTIATQLGSHPDEVCAPSSWRALCHDVSQHAYMCTYGAHDMCLL